MFLRLNCRNPELFHDYINLVNQGNAYPIHAVLLYNYQEWQYNSIGSSPTFDEVVNFVNEREIPFYIINGSHKISPLLHDVANPKYRNIQPIVSYPTFFITNTVNSFSSLPKFQQSINDFTLESYNKEFKYLLACFNHRPHSHRCLQIDLLAKHSLIERSALSWNSIDHTGLRNISAKLGHQWKYWTPEIKILDEHPESHIPNWNWNIQLPDEYQYSFMQLITESTVEAVFITEKTVPALLFGKIFLVSSAPNFHKVLKDYGFLMFDEIFDYSFDQEQDAEKRFDMIASEISKLKSLNSEELKSLYNSVFHKLVHNKKQLFKVSTDIGLWPKFMLELCRTDDDAIVREPMYNWYHQYKLGPTCF